MLNNKMIHPGVYIKDNLEVMEMTAKELSARTGISERTLSSIIVGEGSITFDVAYKLSTFFETSVSYWTNLQNQYDFYKRELEEEKRNEEEKELFKQVKDFIEEYNYIDFKTESNPILATRKLVGVNNLTLLNIKDNFICFKEQHSKEENNIFFQNFWIALAYNEARKQDKKEFNKSKLLNSIYELKKLSLLPCEEFLPKLYKILGDCGINFVLLPYLPKSNIYGITKWLSKNNVMIALSNRGGNADLFWFTLFHEISHVLMQHKRNPLVFSNNEEDVEANKYAENILIPEEEWKSFLNDNNFSLNSIKYFAHKVGVLPLIVLGRLYKENILEYGRYKHHLNVTYKFTYNLNK